MAWKSDFSSKTPLVGMFLVFLAMGIVAVTAYQRDVWISVFGYSIAAAVAIFGFSYTFRDLSDTPRAKRR